MPIIEGRRHVVADEVELHRLAPRVDSQGNTASLRVWATDTQRHGVWQMTPGVLPAAQGPETVVILSGIAEVTLDHSSETFVLKPGDVFVIDAHESATWTVLETVRKFFVINSEDTAS